MASIEERKARVANGSNRKRDLAAAGVDPSKVGPSPERIRLEAWIAENLPGESYHVVAAIGSKLKKAGQPAGAAAIREGLRKRGWLKEQRS